MRVRGVLVSNRQEHTPSALAGLPARPKELLVREESLPPRLRAKHVYLRFLETRPLRRCYLLGVSDSTTQRHLLPPGVAWMLAAAASFAVMAASARLLPSVETMDKILWRSFISVVITGFALYKAGSAALPKRPFLLLQRAVLGFVGLAFYFEAIERVPLGIAVTLYNTTPLFAAVIGGIALGEKLKGQQLVGLLLGLVGVALVQGFSPDGSQGGVLFALGCAAFSAGAYCTVRILTASEHPMTIVMCFPLIAIPLAYCLGAGSRFPVAEEWPWLLVLGLATQSGQVCLTHALSHLTASRATQIGFTGVVFAMLLGVPLGDGLPSAAALGGAAFIFLSLGLAVPRRLRP